MTMLLLLSEISTQSWRNCNMSTVQENLERLLVGKRRLKEQLENKGIGVPETEKVSSYYKYVGKISIVDVRDGTKLANSEWVTLPTYVRFLYNTSHSTYHYTTDFSNMFKDCSNLVTIGSNLITSEATTMRNMFNGCKKLKNIPDLNTDKVTSMYYMFQDCKAMEVVPNLSSTARVTSMYGMFMGCESLTTVPYLDCAGITGGVNSYPMQSLNTSVGASLVNCGGFGNVRVSFSLENCINLSHQSLLNIIECLPTASGLTCTLGATNIAKLTADEIEIARNKGWTIN